MSQARTADSSTMRAFAALSVLGVALLAGAAAGLLPAASPPPGAPAPTAFGQTLRWDLLDCTYVVGITVVETSRVEAYLPEGFAARVQGVRLPAGLPAEGLTNVGFETDVCREGAGLHGPVQGMVYASFWTGVIPPQELRIAGYTDYYVNWDVLVPDADRRDLLQSHGLPARDGSIAFAEPLPGLDLAHVATYSFEGLGDFEQRVAGGPAPPSLVTGKFVQFTQGAANLARWRTDYATVDGYAGVGTLRADPDSWLADLLGAETAPARFFFGTWDYTDGLIELPAP